MSNHLKQVINVVIKNLYNDYNMTKLDNKFINTIETECNRWSILIEDLIDERYSSFLYDEEYNLFLRKIRILIINHLKDKKKEKEMNREKDLKTIALSLKAIVGMIDKLGIIKDVNTLVSEINSEKKEEKKDN